VTHGDVVALSANYFRPDDSPVQPGKPMSGGLFWLAERPGDRGRKPGTLPSKSTTCWEAYSCAVRTRRSGDPAW
jgi:hypothetical protein